MTDHRVVDDALQTGDDVLQHGRPRQPPDGGTDGTLDNRSVELPEFTPGLGHRNGSVLRRTTPNGGKMCPQRRLRMTGYRPSPRVVLLVFLVTSLRRRGGRRLKPRGSWDGHRTGNPISRGSGSTSTARRSRRPQPSPRRPQGRRRAAAGGAAARVGPASEFASHSHKNQHPAAGRWSSIRRMAACR